MRKRRLVVIIGALIISVLVGTLIFHSALVRMGSVRDFKRNRDLFEMAASDVLDKSFDQVELDESGEAIAKCGGDRHCSAPSAEMLEILKSLKFEMIVRNGDDVSFIKESGFQYEMGIVKLANPPITLHHDGRPYEDYRQIDGKWYSFVTTD